MLWTSWQCSTVVALLLTSTQASTDYSYQELVEGIAIHPHKWLKVRELVEAIKGNSEVVGIFKREWESSYYSDSNNLCSASAAGDLEATKVLFGRSVDITRTSCDNGQSPIHAAAAAGHVEVVNYLLDSGVSVHSRSASRLTPLYLASEHGHAAAVQALLERSADVNAAAECKLGDFDHLTGRSGRELCTRPLHAALASNSSAELVGHLLSHRADVNEPRPGHEQRTPLHDAVAAANVEVVDLLLAARADPHAYDMFEKTPFYEAARAGNLGLVERFVARDGMANAPDCARGNPLFGAVKSGQSEIVNFLLLAGPCCVFSTDAKHALTRPNIFTGFRVDDPFEAAMDQQDQPLVSALIAGALKQSNCTGLLIQAVYRAAAIGNEGIYNQVKQAHNSTVDAAGLLPFAAAGGNENIVKEALANMENCTASTSRLTPLHFASLNGHVGTVKLLLACGAPVTESRFDKYGHPIHFAAVSGNVEVLDLLVAAGADIHAWTQEGSMPLHYATGCSTQFSEHVQCGRQGAVVQRLMELNADTSRVDRYGQTFVGASCRSAKTFHECHSDVEAVILKVYKARRQRLKLMASGRTTKAQFLKLNASSRLT